MLPLVHAVIAAPRTPMLVLYGGATLFTLLFLRYVVGKGAITAVISVCFPLAAACPVVVAEARALRRRARKPRRRVYPTVQHVAP
jgi:hypothetical protein